MYSIQQNLKQIVLKKNNKSFQLDGDLLKTMTKYNFNVTHSNPQDQKLFYEFGKELEFDNIHRTKK